MFGARPGHGLAAMFGPRLTILESGMIARPKCLGFSMATGPNLLGSNMTVRLIFKIFLIYFYIFKK
jgi:hypothetical protein